MTVPEFIIGWLDSIWQIFKVPLYDGISGGALIFGVLMIWMMIWFVHMFFRKES